MLNKPNFIPSKYRQPDSYQLIFENWVAVFKISRSEYHVELNLSFFAVLGYYLCDISYDWSSLLSSLVLSAFPLLLY